MAGNEKPVNKIKTLVIGLGNPILTDDGIGVKVAYTVEQNIRTRGWEDIEVTEASVGGLRLMELMIGFDYVILIDSLKLNRETSPVPGRVHKLSLDDLKCISPTQHSASAHDTTLVTALDMGQTMGLHLPQKISIYAVEVENICDFSDEPTPAVAKVIPIVVAEVMKELEENRVYNYSV